VKKIRMLFVALVLALVLVFSLAIPAMATNPIVTITVTAGIVSITNTQANWALGYAVPSEVIYFSADGLEDDNYSTANNTGNLAVDIEIQGVDFDGSYPWTLGAASGNQTYSLYANSGNGTSTYNTEVVKTTGFNDLVSNLAKGCQYVWSMKFTAPNLFNAADDLAQKSATVTLVASEHT
jgi:hypothetical protein